VNIEQGRAHPAAPAGWKSRRHGVCIPTGMMKLNDDHGAIRGLFLGSALALLMILGINVLGHWDQTHPGSGPESVIWMPPR